VRQFAEASFSLSQYLCRLVLQEASVGSIPKPLLHVLTLCTDA